MGSRDLGVFVFGIILIYSIRDRMTTSVSINHFMKQIISLNFKVSSISFVSTASIILHLVFIILDKHGISVYEGMHNFSFAMEMANGRCFIEIYTATKNTVYVFPLCGSLIKNQYITLNIFKHMYISQDIIKLNVMKIGPLFI